MAMNVANCPRCSRLFVKNQFGICVNCVKEIEDQYQACVQFIRENKACTLEELSEATEVPLKQITKFIREGRILIKDLPNLFYSCEVCGSSIREGNICDSCRSKLVRDVNHLQEDENKRVEQPGQSQGTYQINKKQQDRFK